MNIEFKEIKLLSTDVYNKNFYPNTGYFVVNQKDLIESRILVYNDGASISFMLGLTPQILSQTPVDPKKLVLEPNPKSNGLVSEELFLKAMSLMVNKEESYKQ